MAEPVLSELIESRQHSSGGNPNITRTWLITGVPAGPGDDGVALAAAQTEAGLTYGGLWRQSVEVVPLQVDEGQTGTWRATAQYGPRPDPTAGSPPVVAFDTGGGTQHITQSIANAGNYVASGTAPTFGGAIGVSESGGQRQVEGIDIIVPTFAWQETCVFTDSDVADHRAAWYALTGKTNSDVFTRMGIAFAIGEVLFQGCAGQRRGAEDWSIAFKFAARPNRANFTKDGITVTACAGWQFLWGTYKEVVDTGATVKRITKRLASLHVETVYESGAFAGLGMPA